MNIEDLKKITEMALANADATVRFAKKSEDPSLNLLQAYGALCFANSILRNETADMHINGMYKQADEIIEMHRMIEKKMNDIWERK